MAKSTKRILSVAVHKIFDDSPDTSRMGEYSAKPTSPYTIDRATGELCGDTDAGIDWLDRIETRLQEECDDLNELPEGDIPATHRLIQLNAAAQATVRELRREIEDVYWNYPKYRRYFNPSSNYVDTDGTILCDENSEDMDTAENVRKYVREDYARMEGLEVGNWYYLGVRADATVYITGDLYQKITSGVCWGIESDTDYWKDVAKEQLAELKSQLLALGFSRRAISVAFRDVQYKDSE